MYLAFKCDLLNHLVYGLQPKLLRQLSQDMLAWTRLQRQEVAVPLCNSQACLSTSLFTPASLFTHALYCANVQCMSYGNGQPSTTGH